MQITVGTPQLNMSVYTHQMVSGDIVEYATYSFVIPGVENYELSVKSKGFIITIKAKKQLEECTHTNIIFKKQNKTFTPWVGEISFTMERDHKIVNIEYRNGILNIYTKKELPFEEKEIEYTIK